MMSDLVCVLITASSAEEGQSVARAVLSDRLAACVNIVPGVESHYWWEGKLEHAAEVLLVVKTRADLVPRLVARVKEAHSYSVPEVIALPLLEGNEDYLQWVRNETTTA
jgi:periplasmic divalent cation tolerance protein